MPTPALGAQFGWSWRGSRDGVIYKLFRLARGVDAPGRIELCTASTIRHLSSTPITQHAIEQRRNSRQRARKLRYSLLSWLTRHDKAHVAIAPLVSWAETSGTLPPVSVAIRYMLYGGQSSTTGLLRLVLLPLLRDQTDWADYGG